MGAVNGLHPGFRKSKVLHLAGGDEVLHRSSHIFNRHRGIDAMLIVEIDHIGSKALERGLYHGLDMFGPAIQPLPPRASIGIEVEPELGRDHHLIAHRSQRLADQFLVCVGSVNLRRVEKRNAAIDRPANQSDHLSLFRERRRVRKAHAHAPEPQC